MIFKFQTIALGADHGGFLLKEFLKTTLTHLKVEWIDFGTNDSSSVDYPDYAAMVTQAVLSQQVQIGLLICGTGIGVSMAANRVQGIRAAVCTDVTATTLARQHNDANILCLGARLIGQEVAQDCVRTFVTTPFSLGERHLRRIQKLDVN